VNPARPTGSGRFRLPIAVGTLIAAILAGLLLLGWQLLPPSDSDVYLAVLGSQTSAAVVLVSRPSICDHGVVAISNRPPELPEDLFKDFLAANAQDASPVSLERLRDRFAVADGQMLARFGAAGVSPSTLVSGNRELIYLSRIGYNSDHTEALVCVEGKQGDLFHLKRQDGQWRLVQVTGTWMS
jgi:hypothetical protein